MPPSIVEHSDLMWYIIILLGMGIVSLLVYGAKRELRNVSANQGSTTETLVRIADKLDTAIQDVHKRIDQVKEDVDVLKGEHRALHKYLPSSRVKTE